MITIVTHLGVCALDIHSDNKDVEDVRTKNRTLSLFVLYLLGWVVGFCTLYDACMI